jgi:hypothetical protein
VSSLEDRNGGRAGWQQPVKTNGRRSSEMMGYRTRLTDPLFFLCAYAACKKFLDIQTLLRRPAASYSFHLAPGIAEGFFLFSPGRLSFVDQRAKVETEESQFNRGLRRLAQIFCILFLTLNFHGF